jgi:hypothetical protein
VSARDRLGVCPISCLTWCQCTVVFRSWSSSTVPFAYFAWTTALPSATSACSVGNTVGVLPRSTSCPRFRHGGPPLLAHPSGIAFQQSKRSDGRPTPQRAEYITSHRILLSFPFDGLHRRSTNTKEFINIPEPSYVRPTLSTPQFVQRVHRFLRHRMLCMPPGC